MNKKNNIIELFKFIWIVIISWILIYYIWYIEYIDIILFNFQINPTKTFLIHIFWSLVLIFALFWFVSYLYTINEENINKRQEINVILFLSIFPFLLAIWWIIEQRIQYKFQSEGTNEYIIYKNCNTYSFDKEHSRRSKTGPSYIVWNLTLECDWKIIKDKIGLKEIDKTIYNNLKWKEFKGFEKYNVFRFKID